MSGTMTADGKFYPGPFDAVQDGEFVNESYLCEDVAAGKGWIQKTLSSLAHLKKKSFDSCRVNLPITTPAIMAQSTENDASTPSFSAVAYNGGTRLRVTFTTARATVSYPVHATAFDTTSGSYNDLPVKVYAQTQTYVDLEVSSGGAALNLTGGAAIGINLHVSVGYSY